MKMNLYDLSHKSLAEYSVQRSSTLIEMISSTIPETTIVSPGLTTLGLARLYT
jgi:hypothetical protein